MSDPEGFHLPIHEGITSDMLLGLKPAAPRSRSYRINLAPMNKAVFAAGDQMIFELPVSRAGTWLDQSQSYLKFSAVVGSTAACSTNSISGGIYLDNTAYSFIQRLDVYNSSNLLESTNEYGQIANLLLDTALTQSDKAGLATLIGSNAGVTPAVTIASSAVTSFVYAQTSGDRSGLSMASSALSSGSIPSTATPYTFALPLLSGVVGVNASKMIPVGALYNPIRTEFFLAANDDAIYYGTQGAGAIWNLINVELVVCYVEITDDAYHLNKDETHYITSTTYKHASTYLPYATAGEFTTMLPFRAASITGLYGRFRNYATAVQGANSTAAYRKGSSINPNLSSFYWRIAQNIYPNKPIYIFNGSLVSSGTEAYAELLKSFHALSSTTGNTSIMNYQYNVQSTAKGCMVASYTPGNITTTNGTHNNAFAIGIECQSMSNRNDLILSGISTLNSQIYFTGVVASGQVAGDSTSQFNFTFDNWAAMDMVLVIENGLMYAKI